MPLPNFATYIKTGKCHSLIDLENFFLCTLTGILVGAFIDFTPGVPIVRGGGGV
jgi:hypothetical protein